MRCQQPFLALDAELGQEDVAGVAEELFVVHSADISRNAFKRQCSPIFSQFCRGVVVVAVRVMLIGLDVDLIGLLDQARRLLEVPHLGLLGELDDGADDLEVEGIVEMITELGQGCFTPIAGLLYTPTHPAHHKR